MGQDDGKCIEGVLPNEDILGMNVVLLVGTLQVENVLGIWMVWSK